MRDLRMVKEQNLVKRFLSEVSKDNGLAVYGEKEIVKAMKSGLLDTLLIVEDLDKVLIKIRCGNCGAEYMHTLSEKEKITKLPQILSQPCSKCGSKSLEVVEERSLVDHYIEEAEKHGVKVELISSQHEEGDMLKRAFGGIAGFLKGYMR